MRETIKDISLKYENAVIIYDPSVRFPGEPNNSLHSTVYRNKCSLLQNRNGSRPTPYNIKPSYILPKHFQQFN